jgi:virulence factor Mce-like protein
MSGTVQRGVALAAALVLLAAVGWTILKPASQYRVTAYFGQTVGLYSGSDVRILGIPVGTITDVTSEGDRVRVEMLIDDAYDIPADADAVVLAPSLVSDRYVQFAPVYDGGPTMEDGDEVPLERTATPVELDQVYGALDELAAALGPTGANRDGALSDLIDVGAANLDGNGEALNRTLTGFSQAVETLATNREDLFSSLDNLQTFTSALATIDAQVSQFNDNMVAVMDLLASERQDLAEAITLLSSALKDVAAFVRTNSDLVTVNVDRLADVTLALVQQRSALAEVLDVAPAALGNLAHAEVVLCGALAQLGRLQYPAGIDLTDPLDLATLPQTEAVCARLLSGDANNDGTPDEPSLGALWDAIYGSSPAPLPSRPPVGFPALPTGGQG